MYSNSVQNKDILFYYHVTMVTDLCYNIVAVTCVVLPELLCMFIE